jgi:glycosyltransferase involved in cell wall biosynthesis
VATNSPQRPRTPLRVAHVIETDGPGGAETVVRDLVTRRDRAAFESAAIFPSPGGWLAKNLDASEARCAGPTRGSRFPLDLKYLFEMRSAFREFRPDIVHAHSFDGAFYSGLAMLGLRAQLVTTWHGRNDLERSGWRQALKRRVVDSSAASVYVSHSLLRLDDRARRKRAEVVHNGIDQDKFRVRRNDLLRARLGIHGTRLLLGAVGNVREPKSYDVMLRSLAAVSAAGVDAHLFIAGDDTWPLADRMRRLAAELAITDRVTFLGFLETVPEFLNGLDLFVLSSKSEGFSLAVVQAMACGIPVVATRCGGPEEIIEDGVSGTLVAVDSPQALAEGILGFTRDRERGRNLAEQGRRRVTDLFSLDAMIGKYQRLYDSLCGR